MNDKIDCKHDWVSYWFCPDINGGNCPLIEAIECSKCNERIKARSATKEESRIFHEIIEQKIRDAWNLEDDEFKKKYPNGIYL